MPCKVIILGGFPQLTNERYDDYLPPYTKTILMEVLLAYHTISGKLKLLSQNRPDGSILDFTILDPESDMFLIVKYRKLIQSHLQVHRNLDGLPLRVHRD